MPRPCLAAFSLAFTLALAACTPSGIDMTDATSAPQSVARKREQPQYRQNPQPKQAYRITMTLADVPGPFASMTALAQYDVANKECLRPPKDNPDGHTAPVPTKDVEIPLLKVSDTEYVGTVYADRMLDEDYTGRGVCHWQLMQFRVHMKATGAEGETLFIPSIDYTKLLPTQPETVYFNKISYPRLESSSLKEPIDTGESNRSSFGPSIQDDDLFAVTFIPSKEAAP